MKYMVGTYGDVDGKRFEARWIQVNMFGKVKCFGIKRKEL